MELRSGVRARPDWVASLTITAVVVAALFASWMLPWWVMKAQAPQYGQRTLVIEISPRTVDGDVRELDLLGHYVGIRPLGALARLERTLAPFGLAAAVAGVLVAPWLRQRWLRLLAVAPVLVMPIVMPIDLDLWMRRAVNQRDPEAALSLTVTRIDPKLFGAYEVGQFKVATELGAGFYLDVMAAALALGLAFARPLPVPARLRRRRLIAAFTAAGLSGAMLATLPAEAEEVHPEASLAAAVAAARDGDTVVVPAGVHRTAW